MSGRFGKIERNTKETQIQIHLELDGQGTFSGSSEIPFFDHMLNLFTRQSLFNLQLKAQGDLEIDGHHTVEDIGIALGQALAQAMGNKLGIQRYGSAIIPMDEALLLVAVDLSGRAFCRFDLELPATQIGSFDTELVEEFLRALVQHAGLTLHVQIFSGKNTHHIIEAAFKGLGRALRQAVERDPRQEGVPSTKGTLI